MKYKVGDKVLIKSIDWYNKNKNNWGVVDTKERFVSGMSVFCGKILTIKGIEDDEFYEVKESKDYIFSDDSIEKKVSDDEESISNNVNHPSHYSGKIECIEAMEAAFGKESVKNFCRCNAFKYLWRAGKKDNVKQDLEKAVWYINKEIELQ